MLLCVMFVDGVGVYVCEYFLCVFLCDVVCECVFKVVFVYVNGFYGGVFELFVCVFCDCGYVCYVFDFCGYGVSDVVSVDVLMWGVFVDDCVVVVIVFGLYRCAAFGYSCGGYALLMCEVCRFGMFCVIYVFELIFVVFLSDVLMLDVLLGLLLMVSMAYMVKSASRRRARFANAVEALNAYKSKLLMSVWSEDVLDVYVNKGGFVLDDDGGVWLVCLMEIEIGIYRAGDKETTAFGELKSIVCLVVIV